MELSVGARVQENDWPTDCARRFRELLPLLVGRWELRVEYGAKQGDSGEKFVQQAKPFRLQALARM